MGKMKGLARAREIYLDRQKRAQELKAAGRKIMGHFCCYVPREILTAAGIVPFRITGDINESITKGDTYLETCMCPFVRSTVDLAFKGRYDFLDGIVVPHSCDSVEKILGFWNYYFKPGFYHFLNVPHMAYPSSYEFFQEEIRVFKEKIAEFVGQPISDEALKQAISLHNANRTLIRQLYDLRKHNPPLITASETLQVMLAGMVIPVEEHNQLLSEVIAEVSARQEKPELRNARVLIYAAHIDDVAILDLVEECGGHVVIDDFCIGTRAAWSNVDTSSNPLAALAKTYLGEIRCPRTYRPGESVDERFKYLLDYARDFNVNSVMLYITRYCDIHQFDVPDIRDLLQSKGYPVLHIEDDYSATTIGQLKTRIQAFLEMV